MLSLWVPELPFQLACGRDKRLVDRPLAFLPPHPPLCGSLPALWLVNRLARSEGVEAGEAMDRAFRLCPSLQVLDPAPQTWWEAQVSFNEFLSNWTPQGLLGNLGEALLDVHGLGHIFGSPKDASNRILRELYSGMGWRGHGGLSGSGTAARLAARMEHGLECVRDGSEASFLAPHPLKALPSLDVGILFRLQRLGLFQIRDLQPVPVEMLSHFMQAHKAKNVLQCARGEDRPRLPMLADKPGESRHAWRLEPPALPEAVPLAPWLLDKLWQDKRSPRFIKLNWWDVDGQAHRWTASEADLSETPMAVARSIEIAFRQKSERRILIHRLEAHVAWGLGRMRSLFDNGDKKLDALEPALAKLRKRFPKHPVLPGWYKLANN